MFDLLVITSLIYAIAGAFAYYMEEYVFSVLCMITWVSSSLYHYYGEQLFFNFDNIFATSLLIIYGWSFYSSVVHHVLPTYAACGILGLPLSLYFLAASGMPGEIQILRQSLTCLRCQPEKYSLLHSVWHIVGGLGLLLPSWFFHSYRKAVEPTHGCAHTNLFFSGPLTTGSFCYLDESLYFPVIPTIALFVSLLINLLGNALNIMPLD